MTNMLMLHMQEQSQKPMHARNTLERCLWARNTCFGRMIQFYKVAWLFDLYWKNCEQPEGPQQLYAPLGPTRQLWY